MITDVMEIRRVGMSARLLLRVDGVFEAVLGLVLLASPITGLYAALALPSPAVKPVVVGLGILLVPLLPVLWLQSRDPRRQQVLGLAAGNGLGALVFALWVLLWNRDFNTAGAAFVLSVAGILAVLAALQARQAQAAS
jgi:hypothetical protein